MTTAAPPEWVYVLLRCPLCKRQVERDGATVVCRSGHRFPVLDGYVDLWRGDEVDDSARRTAESFGFEWTTFRANNREDEEFWRSLAAGLDLDTAAVAVALDAGCGKGRYTRFIAPRVAKLVALDASLAVEAAVENLDGCGEIAVIRADLLDAPFDDGTFDLVSSIGVLHHLSDPREGFRALARLVAPGGRMFLYLYSRPERRGVRSAGLAVASTLRRVTTRVPHVLLRRLSVAVAAVLWFVFVLPGSIGDRTRWRPLSGLPMHTYRGKPFRSIWLDTFDRLSAPVEHRYVWSELEPWFRDAGLLVESVRHDAGYYVVARRTA